MPIPEDVIVEVDDTVVMHMVWGSGCVRTHNMSGKLYYAHDTYARGYVVAPKTEFGTQTGLLTEGPENKTWDPKTFHLAMCTLVPTVEIYSGYNKFAKPRIVIWCIPDMMDGTSQALAHLNRVSATLKHEFNRHYEAHGGFALFSPMVNDERLIELTEPRLSLGDPRPEVDAFDKYKVAATVHDDMLKTAWTGSNIIVSLKARQRYSPIYDNLARRIYTL